MRPLLSCLAQESRRAGRRLPTVMCRSTYSRSIMSPARPSVLRCILLTALFWSRLSPYLLYIAVAMPSTGLAKLKNNLIDVDRLIKSHAALNSSGRGRRGLGHITRAGVLLLCAAWELYVEMVLVDCAKTLADNTQLPSDLPKSVQKKLSRYVKEAKHDLKPLELAGEGWRSVYVAHAQQEVTGSSLNTPKSTVIDGKFHDLVGVQDISKCWSMGAHEIDEFVRVRGDIAHRGRDADYITINKLKEYRKDVFCSAAEMDNLLADYLKANSRLSRIPWNREQLIVAGKTG